MGRKERSAEEQARRATIRELLELSQVSSMEDIQNLFKETIAEFMEDGLDAELSEELGTVSTTTETRRRITASTGTAVRPCEPVSGRWMSVYPETGKENSGRSC